MKEYMGLRLSVYAQPSFSRQQFAQNGVIMKYYPNTLGIIECAISGSWPRSLAETGLDGIKEGEKLRTCLPFSPAVELNHMCVFWKSTAERNSSEAHVSEQRSFLWDF